LSAKKKGFNEYKIIGDITIIYFVARDGEVFEGLIDTEDLQKLIDLNFPWCARYDPDTDGYYANYSQYLGKENGNYKHKTYSIHRIISSAEKGVRIDHKNHNGLDNRKENLRIASIQSNAMNRERANINNTSGYRNVCVSNDEIIVQIQVNGKNKSWKGFENLEKANEFAIKMREKYYGSFAGNS
jgi:hypothetical protein